MATRGIQEKLSNGTVTEIKIGGTATSDRVITQETLDNQLGNVDNTADLNKPVSTAAQTAIDASTSGVQDALDLKRDLSDSRFGTVTNNATFDEDGHLELSGAATVWEDENMDPTMLTGKGDLPRLISFGTSNIGVAGFQEGRVDTVIGCREYPHKGKLNASGESSVTMNFHFHCYPTSSGGGNAVFRLEYILSEEGVVAPVSVIEDITVSTGTTPWVKQSIGFSDIPVPSTLGAQFHFAFSRVGTDGDDTYGSDVAVSTIGFHYEADGGGSRTILGK